MAAAARLGPAKVVLYAGAGYGAGKFLETTKLVDTDSKFSTTVLSHFVGTVFDGLGTALTTALTTLLSSFPATKEQDTTIDSNSIMRQELRELTSAVALLSARPPVTPVVVVDGSNTSSSFSSSFSFSSTLLRLVATSSMVASLTWGWCKWNNIPLKDIMYATRRQLESACSDLQSRLTNLAALLEQTRRILTTQLTRVEKKIDQTKISLEGTVRREGGGRNIFFFVLFFLSCLLLFVICGRCC